MLPPTGSDDSACHEPSYDNDTPEYDDEYSVRVIICGASRTGSSCLLGMGSLPFLCNAWILFSREDFVIESQQAILPVSLRACRDKSRLSIVIHQRIWKRSRYTPTRNVGQPWCMPIFSSFLQVEDEKNTVILVFKSDAIRIEYIGGKLMGVARHIIKENHRDLKSMCLHVIGS